MVLLMPEPEVSDKFTDNRRFRIIYFYNAVNIAGDIIVTNDISNASGMIILGY